MTTPSATIEPPEGPLAPGETAIGQLRVRHDGIADERFRFEVLGEGGGWVTVSPFALTLGPGVEGHAQVLFRPPRSSAVPAGPHHITIRIRSQGNQNRESETAVTADVTVPRFVDVSATLSPGEEPRASAKRPDSVALTIANRGNDRLRASVAGSDGRGRPISANPSAVELDPGRTQAVALGVPASRPLLGSRRERPFSVAVTPEDGSPVSLAGTVRPAPILSRRLALAIGAGLAVILVAALLRGVVSSSSGGGSSPVASAATNCAGAGHLAHDANGQIRHDVLEPDNYSFLFLQPGGCLPVRWNPCMPIHYVINDAMASPAQVADTRQAADEVAQATGISFVFDGSTTEHRSGIQPYEPSRYGARWAPVLIDWTRLGGASNLIETTGGGIPYEVQGTYVSGVIVLNLDAHLVNNQPIPDGFGSGVTWGRILLHEFGHVLGLGHVNNHDEIMHESVSEETSPTSAYGFGDLAGLRLLGRSAGCLTTPPISS
jgi:hypothetical protein